MNWSNLRNNAQKDALILLKQRPHFACAINGSTVGTSKFLHFVAPEIFPIRDSNIARLFGVAARINDPTYLEYCDAVHRRLGDTTKPVNWPTELRESEGISDVRKIEFCL